MGPRFGESPLVAFSNCLVTLRNFPGFSTAYLRLMYFIASFGKNPGSRSPPAALRAGPTPTKAPPKRGGGSALGMEPFPRPPPMGLSPAALPDPRAAAFRFRRPRRGGGSGERRGLEGSSGSGGATFFREPTRG